jgi:hypothetical protein
LEKKMAKKIALNDELEAQIEALAKKRGVAKEDILLQAIGLMKFIDEKDADEVVVKKASGEVGNVAI